MTETWLKLQPKRSTADGKTFLKSCVEMLTGL